MFQAARSRLPGRRAKQLVCFTAIEVRGERARLFVHDGAQPALIVNDLKSGASAKGAVALWLGPGTIAHFRSLTIQPAPAKE